MNNKRNKFVLGALVLFALGGGALASCGETPASGSATTQSTSVVAGEAVAMRIKGDATFAFQQGYIILPVEEHGLDTVFDDVVVELLDKDQNIVKEVPMLNSTAFTHSEIDTSRILDNASFDLTYKEGDKTFKISVPYKVIVAQIKSWGLNEEYVKFTSTRISDQKNIQDDASGNRPFMKKTAFRVGNQNGMSLFPSVAPRSEEVAHAAIDTLDAAQVSVKLLDSQGQELQIGNYMSEEAIQDLKAHGQVKFNEGVVGAFTLVFQYAKGVSQNFFPDLRYDIAVVNGYNINKAEDLFVLSNDDSDDAIDTEGRQDNDARIAAWKAAKGLPAFNEKYSTGIFQRDIVLTKDNIPDWYIWNTEKDQCNSQLNGSMKDYSFLVKRTFLTTFAPEHREFNLYGNLHTLSLGEDFPRITKMGEDDGEPGGSRVESHSSLFGFFADEGEVGGIAFHKTCKATISDLHGLGNHGITDDTELKNSGELFAKTYTDFTIDNCFLNKWYTTVVYCNDVDEGIANQTYGLVDSSRFDDTYNAMLFNWHNCRLEVKNSELTNAGGPLIFNQTYLSTPSELASQFTSVPDNGFVHPTSVIDIDSSTYLENWTMGRGGWFALYQAENAITTLKAVNQAVYGYTLGQSSFLDNGLSNPTDFANGKFNFLVLNMPAGNSLVPESGTILSQTIIGGKVYVGYDDGRVETLTKLQANDFSPLWSTHFGARAVLDLMMKSAPNALLFSTLNDSGNPVFMAPVDANFTLNSLQSIVMRAMQDMLGLTDEQIEAVAPIDPAFSTQDYLAMSLLGSNQGFLDDPANPFASYVGSNAMTMLVTMEHPKA